MFCGFEGVPSILRLYGKGRVLYRHMGGYSDILAAHFDNTELVGARQIVVLDIDLVQTSCGFGVPVFDYQGERDQLDRWAAAKGSEGMDAYRREKNAVSMDGLPTGMFAET
jgi:hypothetical protein